MVAVVPGKYAIAVYSPPLDEAGNSVRAQKTIEYVAEATKANVFFSALSNYGWRERHPTY